MDFRRYNNLLQLYPMQETATMMDNGMSSQILQEILIRVIAIEGLLQSNVAASPENFSEDNLPEINWTASKTDLIELIYGLHASKAFNNGKITINAITKFFESALAVKLGNTSLRFQEILRRKDSIAFLNQIKDSLESYMFRIDERQNE